MGFFLRLIVLMLVDLWRFDLRVNLYIELMSSIFSCTMKKIKWALHISLCQSNFHFSSFLNEWMYEWSVKMLINHGTNVNQWKNEWLNKWKIDVYLWMTGWINVNKRMNKWMDEILLSLFIEMMFASYLNITKKWICVKIKCDWMNNGCEF